jgi:hypothetical protein
MGQALVPVPVHAIQVAGKRPGQAEQQAEVTGRHDRLAARAALLDGPGKPADTQVVAYCQVKGKLRSVIFMIAACAVLLLSALAALQARPAAAMPNPDAITPSFTAAYCGNDIWAVSITPARSFNPLTATAAQLEVNGYPPRPAASNRHGLGSWQKFTAAHRGNRTSCDLRHLPATASAATPAAAAIPASYNSSAIQSPIWSGYAAWDEGFTDVEASWVYPPAISGTPSTALSSTWVGLGNATTSPLLQAGTESDANGNDYLFFEVYPDQGIQELMATPTGGYEPQQGQTISVHVGSYTGLEPTGCSDKFCLTNTTCVDTTCVDFHISDLDLGLNAYYVEGTPNGWDISNTAEWIYERTSVNGYPGFLANARPTFTSAQAAYSGAWHTLAAMKSGTGVVVRGYTMWDCVGSGTLQAPELASPNPISAASSFSENWGASGHNNQCKNSG